MKKWKSWLFNRIERMPAQVRDPIYRSLVNFNFDLPEGLTVKIAETREELEAAFRLVQKSYFEAGLARSNDTDMRVSKYHALPSTTVLIVQIESEVIGTLSIVKDSALGLPADDTFDLSGLRKPGRKLAELTSLAVDAAYRNGQGEIFFLLGKMGWFFSREYLGVRDLVCTTRLEYAPFYRSLLLFKQLSEKPRISPSTGKEVLAFVWDVMGQIPVLKQYGDSSVRQSVLAFYSCADHSSYVEAPCREYHKITYPVMSPELLTYFFKERTNLFNALKPEELAVIWRSYFDLPAYSQVFADIDGFKLRSLSSRRSLPPQFDSNLPCKGRFSSIGRTTQLHIWRVALNHVDIVSQPGLEVGAKCVLKVLVSNKVRAVIHGQVTAVNQDGTARLNIEKHDRNWKRYIDFLFEDFASLQSGALAAQGKAA